MFTKDSNWTTYEGVTRPLKELEDTHLANIMLHVHNNKYPLENEIMAACAEVLKERGLGEEFVKMTQIPHKNKDGKWACWDYKTNQIKLLQKDVK